MTLKQRLRYIFYVYTLLLIIQVFDFRFDVWRRDFWRRRRSIQRIWLVIMMMILTILIRFLLNVKREFALISQQICEWCVSKKVMQHHFHSTKILIIAIVNFEKIMRKKSDDFERDSETQNKHIFDIIMISSDDYQNELNLSWIAIAVFFQICLIRNDVFARKFRHHALLTVNESHIDDDEISKTRFQFEIHEMMQHFLRWIISFDDQFVHQFDDQRKHENFERHIAEHRLQKLFIKKKFDFDFDAIFDDIRQNDVLIDAWTDIHIRQSFQIVNEIVIFHQKIVSRRVENFVFKIHDIVYRWRELQRSKEMKSAYLFFSFFHFAKTIDRNTFDVTLHSIEQFDQFASRVDALSKKFTARMHRRERHVFFWIHDSH